MTKWEYAVVYVPNEELPRMLELLNVAGVTGWEFTGYTVDTGYGTQYLMKRPTS